MAKTYTNKRGDKIKKGDEGWQIKKTDNIPGGNRTVTENRKHDLAVRKNK